MVVFEVVELVFPPLPPPPPDWLSRTAVSGTSSNGSLSAPAAIVGRARPTSRPTRTTTRLPTELSIFPPYGGTGRGTVRQLVPIASRLSEAVDEPPNSCPD